MSDGAAGNGLAKQMAEDLKEVLTVLSPREGDVVVADCRVFSPEHFASVPRTPYSVPVLLICPEDGMTIEESIKVLPKHVLIEMLEILTK